MRSDFAPRFGFGLTRPMVRSEADATAVTAGTDALYLRFGLATNLPPPLREEFILKEGQRIRYVATWAPSYANTPDAVDPEEALRRTQKFWGDWCSRITLPEFFANDVMRSLITLKACTFEPSGSIVAAPTTSLPEGLGGGRNWDYRFCWLRDGWLTLGAFLRAGLFFEARALTRWLERSAGGSPDQLQIMYGIRGERRLTEAQLDWLPGYADSLPVRVGNGAYTQFQLDVFGEILSTAYIAIKHQGFITPERWSFYRGVAEYVAEHWKDQDQGLWEMRGPKRSFTASKVSAWTAIDRTVRLIQEFHLPQDPAPWVTLRDAIALDINSQGYDNKRKTFTQAYGSKGLDASLLLIALSGFLAPSDPRLVGTVKAIEHELLEDGLLLRYRTEEGNDGLTGPEGVFLPCSFWLAAAYQKLGRQDDARALFEKLTGLCNDVGLLAEEYDPRLRRQLGNFPQAFSHLALVNAAYPIAAGWRSESKQVYEPSFVETVGTASA
jgi:GH15 family glucan-1,4-alpha-glucosidase